MTMKKGLAVRGRTVAGTRIRGTIASVTAQRNGRWVSVRLGDGKSVKTRESLLRVA